jgi:hypothetical protein
MENFLQENGGDGFVPKNSSTIRMRLVRSEKARWVDSTGIING